MTNRISANLDMVYGPGGRNEDALREQAERAQPEPAKEPGQVAYEAYYCGDRYSTWDKANPYRKAEWAGIERAVLEAAGVERNDVLRTRIRYLEEAMQVGSEANGELIRLQEKAERERDEAREAATDLRLKLGRAEKARDAALILLKLYADTAPKAEPTATQDDPVAAELPGGYGPTHKLEQSIVDLARAMTLKFGGDAWKIAKGVLERHGEKP